MKYPPATIAKALARALDNASPEAREKIGRNFIAALKRYGALNKASAILGEAERLMLAAVGRRRVVIETARELEPQKLRELKKHFTEKDNVSERVRPELIAGVKIIINGEEMLDNTLKRKLEKLFK